MGGTVATHRRPSTAQRDPKTATVDQAASGKAAHIPQRDEWHRSRICEMLDPLIRLKAKR